MTDNLELWKSVERTDPAHVKEITGKSYKGNSPKPHWIIFRATETFGPCGIGWGFSIVEEKLLDGALLEPGFYERIHMARVKVWFNWNDKRGEVEHVGQTVFSGRRKGYEGKPGLPFTDEDAPKKSVTDALVKALSLVGFAGDIFMGRYDDSKYVAEVKQEIAAERKAEERKTAPAAPAADPKVIELWRKEVSLCAVEKDLDRLQRTPEFKGALAKFNIAEKEKIGGFFSTARAAFKAREAA